MSIIYKYQHNYWHNFRNIWALQEAYYATLASTIYHSLSGTHSLEKSNIKHKTTKSAHNLCRTTRNRWQKDKFQHFLWTDSWIIRNKPVLDPDLQIRGGRGRSSRPSLSKWSTRIFKFIKLNRYSAWWLWKIYKLFIVCGWLTDLFAVSRWPTNTPQQVGILLWENWTNCKSRQNKGYDL